MRERSEYVDKDDLLREAQLELTTALMQLHAMLNEGERHLVHNVNKVSEHVMKAGRIINTVRGVK